MRVGPSGAVTGRPPSYDWPAMPTYSLVVPAYNEEAVVSELVVRLGQLMDALDGDAEAILVDDGSRDRTYELMVEAAAGDPRFRLVRLSRNFGHQIALTAGVDLAAGDAVVVMDADLQDPPEVVLELAKRWREGYDVVYGVRDERTGETRFKRSPRPVLPRLQPNLGGAGARRRGRFSAGRPTGARRVSPDAREQSLRPRHVLLDRPAADRRRSTRAASASRASRSTRSSGCSASPSRA